MVKKYLIYLLFITLSCLPSFGQTSMKNSIYLIEYSMNYQVNKISFIKAFQNRSYFNQPNFIDDRRILLSADDDNDGMTDILEVNLADQSYYKITDTKTMNEYSPKLDVSKNNIYCITERGNIQTLHMYPRTRDHAGRKIADLKQPGYFEWINTDEVIYFAVANPNKLIIKNVKTGMETEIDQKPGRAFYKLLDKIYYSTAENGEYRLKNYDLSTKVITTLEVLPSQDFIIDDTMNFYSTKGSSIQKRNNDKGIWEPIIDLSKQQIDNLSRIAKRGNKFLIVNTSQ